MPASSRTRWAPMKPAAPVTRTGPRRASLTDKPLSPFTWWIGAGGSRGGRSRPAGLLLVEVLPPLDVQHALHAGDRAPDLLEVRQVPHLHHELALHAAFRGAHVGVLDVRSRGGDRLRHVG